MDKVKFIEASLLESAEVKKKNTITMHRSNPQSS